MAAPFHKWTGGKRWLVRHHAELLPVFPGRLIAPFLGGGAVELHLLSQRRCQALLADSEPRLINAWTVVRDRPEDLIAELALLEQRIPYRREAFEDIRASLNRGEGTPVELAARFLFVLFWGFNGLWRTNGDNNCNVAFGAPSKADGPPPKLGDPDAIREASRALQGADLRCQDFEITVDKATAGDLVFADPPYDPLTATACFTGYGRGNWGSPTGKGQGALFAGVVMDEQVRLAVALRKAVERGAMVMTTNHATERIGRLYAGWAQTPVKVARNGSCDGDARKDATEVIVRSWGAS